MDVNAVPGLMLDESENEGKESYGDINAMQTVFFCGKTGHQKKDWEEEESKLEDRKYQLEAYTPVITVGKQNIFRRKQRREAE